MGVIARQSIKGAIANYIGVAIGFFVQFFVLTKYLTQEEIGLTRVMVDMATLFSVVAALGSTSSVVRFFPYFKDDKNNHGVFGLSVLLPLVGFSLFSIAFLLFREPLLAAYEDKSPLLSGYLYMVPMLTFFALYTTVFETNASVLMRITVPKLVREVGIRVFTLACYLLLGFRVIELTTFVWLFCGSYGLAMVLNLMYLLSLGHISFKLDRGFLDGKKMKEIGRYTLFMSVAVLAGNIPFLNSLFLGAKANLALTGIFSVASNIANVVDVPYRSLGAISRPVIATAVKEEQWDEVNRLGRQVSLHQLMVSLLILFVIWINIDALYSIIPNGVHYKEGVGVVLLLGLTKVVLSSFSVGTDVLNFSRLYWWSLLFTAVLTAAAITFNNLLIPEMGINGAASATLCAYVLYFALLLTHLWRRLRVRVFSSGQLKMVAVIGAGLLLNVAWQRWLLPSAGWGVLVDAGLKTVVLGGIVVAATYFWKISPTVCKMIDIRKMNNKNHVR